MAFLEEVVARAIQNAFNLKIYISMIWKYKNINLK
jgi:hypothetical protein